MSVLTLGALAACSSALTADELPSIATDAATYTAVATNGQLAVTIVATYHNATAAVAEVPKCTAFSTTPVFGVELVDPRSDEGAAYDPAWGCTGHDKELEVAPNASRTDTIRITAPSTYDRAKERYLGEFAGKFRLTYGSYRSNVFEIKLPANGYVPPVPFDYTKPFVVDSTVVHMSRAASGYYLSTQITATIHNGRSDTLFISGCGGSSPFVLQRQVADRWVGVLGSLTAACLSVDAIAPGSAWTTSLVLAGGIGAMSGPTFSYSSADQIPGVYRLVWPKVFTSRPVTGREETTLSENDRRSNAFAIVVDR